MKRILFLLISITFIASSYALEVKGLNDKGAFTQRPTSKHIVKTRASEESLVFGYCYDVYTAVGSGYANTTDWALIAIPEEIALNWKGCYITQVHVGFGKSDDKEVEILVTKNPREGEPIYTQKATMTEELGWNIVDLDTPVELDGEGFFVGYTVANLTKETLPVGVDYINQNNPFSDIFGVSSEEYPTPSFENIGELFGSICVRITLEGDNLPQNNASAVDIDMPFFITTDTEFTSTLAVTNNGVKTINSLDLSCVIGGVSVPTVKAEFPEGPIPSGETGVVQVSGLNITVEGTSLPVVLTINKVNGEANENQTDNSISTTINSSATGYERNVVFEEFTGTWCGWCPRGIVGMAYMEENYGDKGFIGIAGHASSSSGSDPMQSSSYLNVIQAFDKSGFPDAIVDRTYNLNPSSATLEQYFIYEKMFPTYAKTELEAEYVEEDNNIKVTSRSEFSLDITSAKYKMAYVLIENNVGPYIQNNFFPTTNTENLPGWSNNYTYVQTLYNEVARVIVDPFGISFSVPTTIKKGEKYTHSSILPLSEGWKVADCQAIALILDATTGQIINAAKVNIANAEAGVEGTLADENPEVYRVFNSQGVKVLETKDAGELNTLKKGIYIVNGKKAYLGR